MRGDIFGVRILPHMTSQWLITRPCMRNAGNSLVNHKGILYVQHQQVKVSYCYIQNNFWVGLKKLHCWTGRTNRQAAFLWCCIPVCPVIKSSTPWAPAIWLKNSHNAVDSAENLVQRLAKLCHLVFKKNCHICTLTALNNGLATSPKWQMHKINTFTCYSSFILTGHDLHTSHTRINTRGNTSYPERPCATFFLKIFSVNNLLNWNSVSVNT